MSGKYKKDPLLIAARILSYILMGIFALGLAGIVLGFGALVFGWADLPAKLAENGAAITVDDAMPRLLALLGCAALLLAASFRFTQLLGKMIDTVSEGDPFIPENANRLSTMGWLALGFQVLLFPLTYLGAWVATNMGNEGSRISDDIGLMGFVLALVLFILARVFREGTKMRDELEGTV